MEHPFINDLSDLTLEELQEKITQLNKNLTFVYRTQNGPLIHQLNMVLQSYQIAHQQKMDELISKQKITTKISIEKK